MSFLRRMKHEIPSFCAVSRSDVAVHRGFRAARRAEVLRGFCAVPGAELLRNHEKPGGFLAGNRDHHPPVRSARQVRAHYVRVTSLGNVLMHEIKLQGRPDDPITMLYLDEGRLLLTHYCDAGNRPRMVGKMTPDGKTVEFEFLDIAGNPQYHMHHSVFTIIDATHHSEDWTFMVGDKPVVAHFELQRAD